MGRAWGARVQGRGEAGAELRSAGGPSPDLSEEVARALDRVLGRSLVSQSGPGPVPIPLRVTPAGERCRGSERILREYHQRGIDPGSFRRLAGSVHGASVSYLVRAATGSAWWCGPAVRTRRYRSRSGDSGQRRWTGC